MFAKVIPAHGQPKSQLKTGQSIMHLQSIDQPYDVYNQIAKLSTKNMDPPLEEVQPHHRRPILTQDSYEVRDEEIKMRTMNRTLSHFSNKRDRSVESRQIICPTIDEICNTLVRTHSEALLKTQGSFFNIHSNNAIKHPDRGNSELFIRTPKKGPLESYKISNNLSKKQTSNEADLERNAQILPGLRAAGSRNMIVKIPSIIDDSKNRIQHKKHKTILDLIQAKAMASLNNKFDSSQTQKSVLMESIHVNMMKTVMKQRFVSAVTEENSTESLKSKIKLENLSLDRPADDSDGGIKSLSARDSVRSVSTDRIRKPTSKFANQTEVLLKCITITSL